MRLSLVIATILLLMCPLFAQGKNENVSATLKSQDFTVDVVDADGEVIEFTRKKGVQVIESKPANAYAIRLTNTTNERIMVVVAIDGVNPYTGRRAVLGEQGPVIDPGKTLELRQNRTHKKAAPQNLQFDRDREMGSVYVVSFRERMDYPHLLPWSDHLAKTVGGEARKGLTPGTLLWLPPSGAPFRKLSDEPSSAVHFEYQCNHNLLAQKTP